MELEYRSIVLQLKEILRQNNLLLEDVSSVYTDINGNYVIQIKPKVVKED